MIAKSATRAQDQTDQEINDRIRQETEKSIGYYLHHPDQIDQRLEELDEEWDIERLLQANASALIFATTVLGITRNRLMLLMPLVVSGFLFQHAVQGWCPPLPVFRRLGFRTPREIDTERLALKLARGDFEEKSKESSPPDLMEAAK